MSQIARRAFFGFAAAAPFAAASAVATALKPQARAVVTLTLDADCFSSAFDAAMEKRDREIMDRLWGTLRVPSVRWADVEIGAQGGATNADGEVASMRDLPNQFSESVDGDLNGETAVASSTSSDATAVTLSSREASATSAPGMAHSPNISKHST